MQDHDGRRPEPLVLDHAGSSNYLSAVGLLHFAPDAMSGSSTLHADCFAQWEQGHASSEMKLVQACHGLLCRDQEGP